MTARYGDSRRRILVANSDGLLAEDDQVRTRFTVQCVAVGDTGMQTGYEAPGRTVGFELFDEIDVEEVARTAARRALEMLKARPAPSGKIPVVLKHGRRRRACSTRRAATASRPTWSARDASVFRGRVGEQVASPAGHPGRRRHHGRSGAPSRSTTRGTPAQRNVLIEDGVLTDYMWDFLRARKEGRQSSGNGRRQSYQHLPMVRMTNTYVLAGEDDPDEIIASTRRTACTSPQLGGGQVNTATGDFVFGMTEAYLIEDGEITEPIREANLIGNGPEVLQPSTPSATTSTPGPAPAARTARACRSATASRPCGWAPSPSAAPPTNRVADELLSIAERVAAQAADGEQVEAYVARAHDTDVKVFGGEVESLSSAETEGVGVRVVVDQRQGFAYAGSLDPDVVAETLAEARDNAGFGTADEYLGLPEPDGSVPADLDLFREDLDEVSAEDKVALALEVERATRAADSRIRGVETAEYGDAAVEAAIASNTGVRATARRTVCSIYAYALAGEGAETQTGYGYSVGRHPDELDVAKASSMAADRATRMLGATKPTSRRLTVVLDPLVTAQFLGVLSSALSGESVLKGRSLFADRVGEPVAASIFTLSDDPTDTRGLGAETDAEGLATRRNDLIEDGVLQGFLHNTYTGRRSGTATTGSAMRAGFKSTPGVGSRALSLVPGDKAQEQLLAEVGDGLLVRSAIGLHSGTNPVSGDFSVGAEGLMVRGGALAEPVREVTIASTLQRMLQDVTAVGADLEWLPGGAAGVTLVIGDVSLSGT